MKKDLKTIDMLLDELNDTKTRVNEYHEKSERLIAIKDEIINILERQNAIYKRDLNIMYWVMFIFSVWFIFILIASFIYAT
jgi:hypothetical protein